jgi:hypothetical protein
MNEHFANLVFFLLWAEQRQYQTKRLCVMGSTAK